MNIHLLETKRPDLTAMVANLVNRHHSHLAGTIRTDYFVKTDGVLLGIHRFYIIFREPGSIGQFTTFICGASSGNVSPHSEAFKRMMDTLQHYSAPMWTMHPHDSLELLQLFGILRNAHGLVAPNPGAMQGYHPGQYDVDFLECTDQFVQEIRMVLRESPNRLAAHEAFLLKVMANYGLFWETVYGDAN